MTVAISPFSPSLPSSPRATLDWHGVSTAALPLALANAARAYQGLLLVITPDSHSAQRLELEIGFFAPELERVVFPDWETLPYDWFSPHQDITSQRLASLYRLPQLKQGLLIVPIATLLQRLCPPGYVDGHSLVLKCGQTLDRAGLALRLDAAGYRRVSQVMEHGEFAQRGSLLDIYPMGSVCPYRIDLLDDEVDSIRTFDVDTQRTIAAVAQIQLLPAREFPLTKEAITRFRQAFRSEFAGDPQQSPIYREVSDGNAPGGIEYYLPLFFSECATLLDYLPSSSISVHLPGLEPALHEFRQQLSERYAQHRYDRERPILAPERLYLTAEELEQGLQRWARVQIAPAAAPVIPELRIEARAEQPAAALEQFLSEFDGRVLLVAESAGRREQVLEQLRRYQLRPQLVDDWVGFVRSKTPLALSIAPLEQPLLLETPSIAVLTEAQLFGQRPRSQRRRSVVRDAESIVRNLDDLEIGAPVVHEDHGVGRYQGLQTLEMAGLVSECVVLEYASGGKLYVPVAALHKISRYTGTNPELAPLHKLGSDQWEKAKRKAAEKVSDAAAELLELYARRATRAAQPLALDDASYQAFAAGFPFEETPDQAAAIAAVLADLRSGQPMERVVCGDVGFGKTEVAMRAAFAAVQDGRQVAVLVPTTLLAQQHYQNFLDRFADWPVRVESISRFRSKKEQTAVLDGLASGQVDIVIGTHKLIQEAVQFKQLGLVIIDEEHRFGVKQKESLKKLRAEVDILTLTATPIPRTLNMAMSGLRELSIIATPPAGRLAVKTFVNEWSRSLIQEACQRELKRGGQVYFLHNEVESIERIANELREMVPQARIAVAHGQMRERELEQVMLDFYHQRCNVLVCSTIVESGIDVPSANTMIINRADKLGLAQLHQLRGRVGRSHHRAYCYLITPHKKAMTADALKRIEAIESLEDLGAGFMLANHDLEIRGAGELLGEEQSGQIFEVGFTLYMELLERAVKALKAGQIPELDRPLDHGPEVDLQAAALIPEDYLPDVHSRLILYKRIASATTAHELEELQVEMIDRFGLLPEAAKTLFSVTALKLLATPLGVKKIEVGVKGGRILFGPQPQINTMKLIALLQSQPQVYKLDGQEKLRFSAPELATAEQRAVAVEALLRTLS